MPEKFKTTEGKEVYINPSSVVSTEQTSECDLLNFVTLGLLGSDAEVTIKTNDGSSIVVDGLVDDVNKQLGK